MRSMDWNPVQFNITFFWTHEHLIDDSYIPCLLSLHFIFCWKLIYGEIFQGTLAIADMMIGGKITNNNLYKFYVSYNRRNQYLDFLRNEDKEQNYAKNLDGWTTHFRKCKYKLRFSNCIAKNCVIHVPFWDVQDEKRKRMKYLSSEFFGWKWKADPFTDHAKLQP